MKDRGKVKKWFFFLLIAFLLLYNLSLLYQVVKLKSENHLWKSKVILSIEDQQSLYEHRIEGECLGDEIGQLAGKHKNLKNLINENKYLLIYIFKGISCDRCFSKEINVYRKYKEFLKSLGILPIMIFTEISEDDYIDITRSANIENISTREDSPGIFSKYNELRNSILLFVGKKRNIIIAAVLDYYRDELKSEKFYHKLMEIMQNL
ncbi:MAG: hypothetical protein ACPLZD_03135 [Candidatus Saccharicenans sp.]